MPSNLLLLIQFLTTMFYRFKLKKAYVKTHCAYIDERLSWELLSSRIGEEFSISPTNVGLTFVQNGKESTLKNDENLQLFYSMNHPSEITFVVQDLKFPNSGAISAASIAALLMSHFSFHLPASSFSLR